MSPKKSQKHLTELSLFANQEIIMKKILLTSIVFVGMVGVGILAFNQAISPTSTSVIRSVNVDRDTAPTGSNGY
jgi:hypothetical protein